MTNTIYATKSRMTQVYQDGKRVPLTILRVEDHVVLDSKLSERDGYQSTVLGIGQKTKSNKPGTGSLKKLSVSFIPRLIKEVKSILGVENGQSLDMTTLLIPGSKVNVTASSKGKGFSGVVKRWGFAGGPRTHGQSDRGRAPGSIGRGTTPGRVLKGKKMAGRMGGVNMSVRNLSIIKFDPQTKELHLSGPVPGSVGSVAKITIISNTK